MSLSLTSTSGAGSQEIGLAEEANIARTYCMLFLLHASSVVEVGEDGVDEAEQFFIFNIQLFLFTQTTSENQEHLSK